MDGFCEICRLGRSEGVGCSNGVGIGLSSVAAAGLVLGCGPVCAIFGTILFFDKEDERRGVGAEGRSRRAAQLEKISRASGPYAVRQM